MKIREGFILRDVAGKTYVVATGDLSKEFNGIITLNETGKFIWSLLQNDITRDAIVDAVMERYEDADRNVVEHDVDDFLTRLKNDNVLDKLEIDLNEVWPLINETISSGGEFRLFHKGTSMMPLLRQGIDSVLLVSPNELKKNDIVLYLRESGQFVMHRIVKLKKNSYTMCGDNQCTLEAGIEKKFILAKVKGIYRGDEYFETKNKRYMSYVRKLPIRRLKIRILGAIRKKK